MGLSERKLQYMISCGNKGTHDPVQRLLAYLNVLTVLVDNGVEESHPISLGRL